MYRFPIAFFESVSFTKGELAKRMKLQETYGNGWDYALPQAWLDDFCTRHKFSYDHVLFSTFWCYSDEKRHGEPVSGCTEIQTAIHLEEKSH